MNKLYIGFLLTSASVFFGCSEFEDTEITSPQADDKAIGANFAKESQTAQVTPDSVSFAVVMNRVNPDGTPSIKVSTIKNTNEFCTPPAAFVFEAGKTASKKVISYDISKCTFQKPDTLTLKIDAESKDHIYGAGYLQTSVQFIVDYTWKDSISVTASDKYISDANFPLKAQVAMDFDKKKEKTRTIVRIADYFKNAGKTTSEGAAHIQFAIDNEGKGNPKLVWDELSSTGISFNKDEIETGVSVKRGDKDKDGKDILTDVFMKNMKIEIASTNTYSDSSEEDETEDITYKLTYELYYKNKDKQPVSILPDSDNPDNTEFSCTFTLKYPKSQE